MAIDIKAFVLIEGHAALHSSVDRSRADGGWRQLKRCAVVVKTSFFRRAIEISCSIHDHGPKETSSEVKIVEVVQHGLGPAALPR